MNYFNKISDFLYHIVCDSYDADSAYKYLLSQQNVHFSRFLPACSTIRSGSYFGRNFDFFYSKLCEYVVYTPHTSSRYASLGISCPLGEITNEQISETNVSKFSSLIPYFTWDGINENGVVFSANVVPAKDLKHRTSGTNPEKEALYTPFIGREILDYAASANEAVQILENRNIITPDIFLLSSHDLHFMIADDKETYVVEFFDNKLTIHHDAKLMTNFYLSDPYLPHSCGLERYQLLKANYEQGGKGVNEMSNLLKNVRYSRAFDTNTNPFWYTEYLGYNLMLGNDITIYNVHQYDNYIREEAKKISYKERGGIASPWFTLHSSIYDIPNRSLRLFTQENYDICYEFSSDPSDYCVKHTL